MNRLRAVSTHRLVGLLLLTSCVLSGTPASAGETFHLFDGLQQATQAAAEPSADKPSLAHLLGEDLRFVATSPGRLGWRGWASTALAVGTIAAIMSDEHGDVDVEQVEGNTTERSVARLFEPLGQEGAFVVLGGFLLAGTAGHNERAHDVAIDGAIASLIAAGLITPAIKGIAGRSRPLESADATDFKPFSGHASFPSGHTTEAFAVASVIATEYRSHWVDVAAYGSASLVGYARTLHDRHYTSDVVAGALIGTLVGRAVARHNRTLRGVNVTVSPLLGPHGGAGLAVDVHLPPHGQLR